MAAHGLRDQRQATGAHLGAYPVTTQVLEGGGSHKGAKLLADALPEHVDQVLFHQIQVGIDEAEIETKIGIGQVIAAVATGGTSIRGNRGWDAALNQAQRL